MATGTTRFLSLVASATIVSTATTSGFIAYFNGNTRTNGTSAATTLSGATVTAGGGAWTANVNGVSTSKKLVSTSYMSGAQLTLAPLSSSGKVIIGRPTAGKGGILCVYTATGAARVIVASQNAVTARAPAGTECTQ